MRKQLHYYFLLSLALLALFACEKSRQLPHGVLALVNDQAITLEQVEAYHDANINMPFIVQKASVELLQKQYGNSLGSLIVLALLEQELERRNFPIVQQDIDLMENRIRSEYPSDMFNTILESEFIDLKSWREVLKWRLILEHFNEKILRPTISIDPEEIKAAYLKEQAFLSQPARTRLILVSGNKKEACETARETYIKTQQIPEVKDGDIQIEVLQLAESRMPRGWLEHVKDKAIGTVTPVFEEQGWWTFCIIQERSEAKQLTISEAYTLLEASVLEPKLMKAFDEWLVNAANDSKILISKHLHEVYTSPNQAPPTPPDATKTTQPTKIINSPTTQPQIPKPKKETKD